MHRSFRAGSIGTLVLVAALASCLDFTKFEEAGPPEPVCPTALPDAVCVAPSTQFTEDLANLPFQANPTRLAQGCGDDVCLAVEAIANERNEATSKDTSGLSDACVASISLVDPTTKAWSYLALTSASTRLEVAVRPGKVRLTAGGKTETQDIAADAVVDTLRIQHTAGAIALEALAGTESVGCFTIESDGLVSGAFRVRIGVDARDDADVDGESTKFDAYGSATEP